MTKMSQGHDKRSRKKTYPKGPSSEINMFKKNKAKKVKSEEKASYNHTKPFKGNAKHKNNDIEVPAGEVFIKPKSKPAKRHPGGVVDNIGVELRSRAEQLEWFTHALQEVSGSKLSSLEVDEIPDDSVVELSNTMEHSIQNLSKHIKTVFGSSWKEVLCEESLDGNVEHGSPALLVISSSAMRCVELLRGLQNLTTKCHAAKLFAKHIKIEEQVSILKGRVNIAGGTPSRIKRLIDVDALGLSRLSIVLLDMHKDAKGFTLFTIPQVSTEFWELYKTHFHQHVVQGKLQLCLY